MKNVSYPALRKLLLSGSTGPVWTHHLHMTWSMGWVFAMGSRVRSPRRSHRSSRSSPAGISAPLAAAWNDLCDVWYAVNNIIH